MTEEGDIIVMYCLSPRSYIHSIWRAIGPGAVEPFRHFYNTVWIGFPQFVKPLTYSELRSDAVLKDLPIVKSKMQGINGRNIPKKFYDRILDLLQEKGTDIGTLPQLSNVEPKGFQLKNERDVEMYLLEPLLKELGFYNEDWQRQVRLQVGRSEKVIPDYLINVFDDVATKTVRADWVWEAKYSILSHEQLQKDFGQVCSYAKLVGAKGIGLISKEGVWVGKKDDGFAFNKSQHWSAVQIQEVDHLNELRTIAGKSRILK